MTYYEIIFERKNLSENRKSRKRSNYCYSDTESFTTDSSNDNERELDNTQISQNIDQATHANEKPFICNEPGCGKKFSLKNYLSKHRKRKHHMNQVSANDEFQLHNNQRTDKENNDEEV
jgi:hypothetical protein